MQAAYLLGITWQAGRQAGRHGQNHKAVRTDARAQKTGKTKERYKLQTKKIL
jgi:hypothetical protein